MAYSDVMCIVDLQNSPPVFSRKHMKLPELVVDLRRLLHRQHEMQAQLPELQPSLCRKAMLLHREVSSSGASCWVRLRSVE